MTFMAQGEYWRDGVREFTAQVKLGDFGEMTTRQARGKAKEALGSIAKGQRPGEDPPQPGAKGAGLPVVAETGQLAHHDHQHVLHQVVGIGRLHVVAADPTPQQRR